MQKITVISVGRLKESFFKAAEDEYVKRLKGLCDLKIIEINQEVLPQHPPASRIEAALETEAQNIISKIPKNSQVIPLCIEGKNCSSEELAEMVEKNAFFGSGSMTFIIGGSYGLSKTVKEMGSIKLSMSKMTFPHRLARIMLLEQIYRAYKILSGAEYHK